MHCDVKPTLLALDVVELSLLGSPCGICGVKPTLLALDVVELSL